tara:strand:- start:373 stop:588 length:216 start_codon:yes stop_codon:yes gene_type:complete
MEFMKKFEDIKFNKVVSYGEEIEVSENIVMASAAGWYVGAICKEDGMVMPYGRYTGYYATPEEASKLLGSV